MCEKYWIIVINQFDIKYKKIKTKFDYQYEDRFIPVFLNKIDILQIFCH